MPVRMQSRIPIPKPLHVRDNLAQNWRQFRQVWNSYEVLTNLQSPELMEYRVATFITCVGHAALRIYNSLQFEEDAHKRNMEKIIQKMEQYCLGETDVIYKRYI